LAVTRLVQPISTL